jgi:hypothetical protein
MKRQIIPVTLSREHSGIQGDFDKYAAFPMLWLQSLRPDNCEHYFDVNLGFFFIAA